LYSGVCHTDAFYMSGEDPEAGWPAILGHEGGGIVESIGEGVTTVKPGDHVIPCYIPECGECEYCKSKKTNVCSKIRITQGKGLMPDNTSRFSVEGEKVLHFMGTSTFSQYTVCAEISVAKINQEAPLDKVCLLGCGITTGYGAVLNTLKVEEGSSICIVGLGGVGLGCIMGAVNAKAKRIIGVDTNPGKFERAKAFGCTDFVNPKDYNGKALEDIIFEMTEGRGVDYSIECVGQVALMRSAFLSTKIDGGCSCIVGVAGAGQTIKLAPEDIMGREWCGSAFGGTKSRSTVPKYVDQYMNKEIKVDEFITHRFPLKDINKAFEVMHNGECIRAVIDLHN